LREASLAFIEQENIWEDSSSTRRSDNAIYVFAAPGEYGAIHFIQQNDILVL